MALKTRPTKLCNFFATWTTWISWTTLTNQKTLTTLDHPLRYLPELVLVQLMIMIYIYVQLKLQANSTLYQVNM